MINFAESYCRIAWGHKSMSKLTATKVKNAATRNKEYKLHDGDGLFLRIRPGGAKSWLFSFNLPGV